MGVTLSYKDGRELLQLPVCKQTIALRALVCHDPIPYVGWATEIRIVGWATYRYRGLRIRMSVLSEFRSLPGAIRGLTTASEEVVEALKTCAELLDQNGPSDDRLQELELGRARWEAEMEARLMRADSTLKAASNAESRSRTMIRHAEKLVDPFDDESEDVEETLPVGNGQRVEEEEVLPVPLGLAPNNKAHALRAKWLT